MNAQVLRAVPVEMGWGSICRKGRRARLQKLPLSAWGTMAGLVEQLQAGGYLSSSTATALCQAAASHYRAGDFPLASSYGN